MRLLQLIARCALAAAFVPRPLPSHTAALTRRSGAITMPTNVDADGNVVDGPGDVEEDVYGCAGDGGDDDDDWGDMYGDGGEDDE